MRFKCFFLTFFYICNEVCIRYNTQFSKDDPAFYHSLLSGPHMYIVHCWLQLELAFAHRGDQFTEALDKLWIVSRVLGYYC